MKMETCQCMGFLCVPCQTKIYDKWLLTPKYLNEKEKCHQESMEGVKKLLIQIIKKSDIQYYSQDEVMSLINNL